MKFYSAFSALILILFCTETITAQYISDRNFEIIELRDTRSLGKNNNLKEYLHSLDPEIRQSAIYALANIADSNTVGYLDFLFAGPFKDYPTKDDIKAAAFMLGQIDCDASRSMLSAILNNRSDYEKEMLESGIYIIDAIGKTGDVNNLNELLQREDLVYSDDRGIRSASVMAVARFALRNIKNEKSVEYLKKIVNTSADTLTLRNAVFAFWRTGDRSLLENAKQEIYSLTVSGDAQTRMWAFSALAKLKDLQMLDYTLDTFDEEKDWRVKVNILNSLRNYNIDSAGDQTSALFDVLGSAINDSNMHISLTGISAAGDIFKDIRNSKNYFLIPIAESMKNEVILALNSKDTLTSLQRSGVAHMLSLMYRDEIRTDLLKTFSETDDYDLKGSIVTAFGNFNDYKVFSEVRDSISAEVKRYNDSKGINSGEMISGKELAKIYRGFVRMLSSLMSKTEGSDRNMFRLMFTEFAGSKDPVITDICLTALKDTIFSEYREETSSVILFDYNELKYPDDEAVIMIFIDAMKDLHNKNTIEALEKNLSYGNFEIAKASADALEKITWKKYPVQFNPRTDFDRNYLSLLNEKKNVIIKTSKGDIRIELFPDAAPMTVLNFLKLSEKNFYDGTVFHRVVSNFVIQGGDPTGTGYGGPGYSIRSEFSPLEYETGYIGMASSGKDTEGSQFFITHSATPHLDGKYTIFGKVTEGMDAVDKIMVGDMIIDIVSE